MDLGSRYPTRRGARRARRWGSTWRSARGGVYCGPMTGCCWWLLPGFASRRRAVPAGQRGGGRGCGRSASASCAWDEPGRSGRPSWRCATCCVAGAAAPLTSDPHPFSRSGSAGVRRVRSRTRAALMAFRVGRDALASTCGPADAARLRAAAARFPGMARVTGIGGFFFRAKDPDALNRWYAEHFGVVELESQVLRRPGLVPGPRRDGVLRLRAGLDDARPARRAVVDQLPRRRPGRRGRAAARRRHRGRAARRGVPERPLRRARGPGGQPRPAVGAQRGVGGARPGPGT